MSKNVETVENVIEDESHFITKIVDNDLGGRSFRESKNECGEVGGVEKMSLTGSKLMVRGEECLEGCVNADGGEVSGGGDDFGGGMRRGVAEMDHYNSKLLFPVSSPGAAESNENCVALKGIIKNGLDIKTFYMRLNDDCKTVAPMDMVLPRSLTVSPFDIASEYVKRTQVIVNELLKGVLGLEVFHNGKWVVMSGVPNAFLVLNADHLELHRAVVKDECKRITLVNTNGPSLDTIVSPSSRLVDEQDYPGGYLPMKYGECMELQTTLTIAGKHAFDILRLQN
ncbi:DMR6-like oxygenase 2-like protein [Tanacetum coccineum]